MSTPAEDDDLGDLMSAMGTDKTEVPPGITVDDLQKYAKLDKALKKATPTHKALGNKIKAAYVKVGTFAVLNIIIKRTKAEKVDWKKVEDLNPQSSNPHLYKKVWVLDQDAVKAELDLKPYTDVIERISIDTLDN
jgi:hypothetical protein